MIKDVFSSIAEWVKERTTSPLYGTFIFSLILWNWKFFYILFWQSETKLPLSRIEYVQKYILDTQNIWTHVIFFLICPALSTFVILWWLPLLSNLAHKKHINFYYERLSIMDELRLNYEKKQKQNLESISEIKKEKIQVEKKIKENTSKEDKFAFEYELFKKNPLYSKLKQLSDIIYSNSGMTRKLNMYSQEYDLVVSADILASADILGLITISGTGGNERIEFTDKGKFFISKILEDN